MLNEFMKTNRKSTFVLFFANRGFFPGALLESARNEMKTRLESLGYSVLLLDSSATRYGAVETVAEGKIFAEFLSKHEGEFQGVILSLPNFGDENGAVAALKQANVPILIHAYPDEFNKMAPAFRRDAFCGKFSIMDVFVQNKILFTNLQPHTTSPNSKSFEMQLDYFDRLCRVTSNMKNLVIGAIGARTSAFKTVRIDEVALQQVGITVETVDLSSIFHRMEKLSTSDNDVIAKHKMLLNYSDFGCVPKIAIEKIAKLGVVLERVTEELGLQSLAVRCWSEMQEQLNISPCVLLSEMNNRGLTAACEVDVGNAVAMHALRCASGDISTCLDWNNNYNDEDDKCILFHCGPVPAKMMTGKGVVTDHAILANAVGEGCSWGCNTGRIAAMDFTFSSIMTSEGKPHFYLGEGEFTKDPIPADFFGCAGVAQINGLQKTLQILGTQGYRHHVSVTPGHVAAPAFEAMTKYLGYSGIQV